MMHPYDAGRPKMLAHSRWPIEQFYEDAKAVTDQEKIAAAISKMELDTVYGKFKVNQNGIQQGFKSALLQWQKGKQVLVWPDDLAQGKAILPTPPWSERK